MANTFTQIHIHTVFAVQNRISLINKDWQDRLYKYIIAIIQKHEHKVLSIGGMPNHVHILIGFRPTQSLSALMQEVKRDSSEWINQNKFVSGRFSWQEGYGAFSYSKSQISRGVALVSEHIKHLIPHGETTTVQFKIRAEDTYKMGVEMVAFSNTQGGTLIIGMNDKTGAISGLSFEETGMNLLKMID